MAVPVSGLETQHLPRVIDHRALADRHMTEPASTSARHGAATDLHPSQAPGDSKEARAAEGAAHNKVAFTSNAAPPSLVHEDPDTIMLSDPPEQEKEMGQHRMTAPLPLPRTSRDRRQALDRPIDMERRQDGVAHGVTPPSVAPKLRAGHSADFRPWLRDGPEDVLNETVMRAGFSDKPANSGQSESNIARPIIWSNIKNKNGLFALSTLFIQTMDKRQALGKCTNPSTFKPPPRVTLTDTKREAWLRDLASDSVPLKKLSRTIPHGIRNKVLLDQCLSKRIPLSRAIWLVKCVGSNEIRASKRKGAGASLAAISGEIKWIKEWTLCVQQFLDSAIRACGQPDWTNQIRYVIRLVNALVTNDLLDREHFLRYITTSFSSSTTHTLPLWLLLVQMLWQHLVNSQSRGRRLGEAIVLQLQSVEASNHAGALDMVRENLDRLLLRLATTVTPCAVALKQWTTLRPTFMRLRDRQAGPNIRHTLQQVLRRNDLLDATARAVRRHLKTERLILIEHLDGIDWMSSIEHIQESCQRHCSDTDSMIMTLVDWATTKYRCGVSRIYCAVRLLRHIASLGYELEKPILHCLTISTMIHRDEDLFNRIISELVQSGDFNFGKYLQWMISSGSLAGLGGAHLSLVLSIGPERLSPQSVNLRKAILTRLGNDSRAQHQVEALVARYEQLVSNHLASASDWSDITRQYHDAETSTRVAVSNFLVRRCINDTGSVGVQQRLTTLPQQSFAGVRAVLEAVHDYCSLQRLLAQLIPHSGAAELAVYAMTVLRHLETFKAMTTLQDLVILLHRAHARQKITQTYDKDLICALLTCCKELPRLRSLLVTLEQDLVVCEQQQAAAVCSPASDSMLVVRSGDVNSDADIDRILGSGNMMDEQLLARLFSAIVERTVKWTVSGSMSLASPCRWFAALRVFDAAVFDRHMNNLLNKLVTSAGTDQVRAILIALVASACLKPADALAAFVKRLDTLDSSNAPTLPRFAAGTLQTFLPLDDLDHQKLNPEIYAFQIAQINICKAESTTVLRLFWHASALLNDALNPIFTKSAFRYLSSLVVEDAQAVVRELHVGEPVSDPKASRIIKLLWSLLHVGLQDTAQLSQGQISGQIHRLVHESDELSIPFARLIIRHMGAIASADELVALRQTFESAIAAQTTSWSQLLDGASTEVAASLYHSSSNAVLQAISDLGADHTDECTRTVIKRNLQVTSITSTGTEEGNAHILDKISESLLMSHEKLMDAPSIRGAIENIMFSITSLLQLVISIASNQVLEKVSPSVLQTLVGNLCRLLANRELQMHLQICETIHDVCALLVRSLTTEQLASTSRRIDDLTSRDRRVRFLLGTLNSDSHWLAYATRVPVPGTSTASPNPAQTPFPSISRSISHSMPSPRALANSMQAAGSALSAPLTSPNTSQPTSTPWRTPGPVAQDIKYTPYAIRKWEVMQDPTPVMGANDTSISLQLFAARKVL